MRAIGCSYLFKLYYRSTHVSVAIRLRADVRRLTSVSDESISRKGADKRRLPM